MPWIFGSFLVTPCALTSCHALMSKQGYDSTPGHSGSTRDENHAVRFRQSAENRCRVWDTQPIRGVSACKGVQALAPPGSQKKIWVEVL